MPRIGVHWGADLMAHVRQEVAFGLVGLLGLRLRLTHLGLTAARCSVRSTKIVRLL
jgi:hypothetical protein